LRRLGESAKSHSHIAMTLKNSMYKNQKQQNYAAEKTDNVTAIYADTFNCKLSMHVCVNGSANDTQLAVEKLTASAKL